MIKIRKYKKLPIILLLALTYTFTNAQDVVHIQVNPAIAYQTIENFGASDAWACQYVGQWPDQKKEKIADLLFSTDTSKNGDPKGIGLSLWRFNIGAGSTAQKEQSNIKDEWRQTESFLNPNGSYDWSKQAGQVWFLKAAKNRGVKLFLGFSNSPPVSMTINGRANTDGGKTNIAPANYAAYASFLASVVGGIHKITGIQFSYLSPLNEPQWDWNGGQEGCPYTNAEIANLSRSIDTVFTKKNIRSKIVIAEAGSLNYLVSGADKPQKGNQINDFFHITSPDYIGNLHSLNRAILGHDYFTTSPANVAQQLRSRIADSVRKYPKLNFWQSEYCILGDNSGDINGNKRDTGMNAALYLATVIHRDLTIANATAWQWWTAISPYDYKDGLIYIDKNKNDGNYYDSKMLWAFGNYSRFIRPGAIRISAETTGGKDLEKPLLVDAFKEKDGLAIIIINGNKSSMPISIDPFSGRYKLIKRYTTSETSKLAAEDLSEKNNPITVPERSVTTIIYKAQ